jgi:integrase
LRSALDYLIWATAVHMSGALPPPGEGALQYPIYDTEQAWTNNLYRLKPLADHHREMLREMQPFASDNDANYLGWIVSHARNYAALRPEEAIDLRREENLISLPERGWGELRLTHSQPRSGTRWTDSGKSRERRELKHRAAGETRLVPVHPELVTLLRDHLDLFGTGPGGQIFTGPRGGIVAEWSYLEVFHTARREALAETEAATPLMGGPYDLRHAAVSTWLNAGVPAAQVAEWAGHSVDVLLRVYVKCIAGQQGEAKRRIEDAMGQPEDGKSSDSDREAEPG